MLFFSGVERNRDCKTAEQFPPFDVYAVALDDAGAPAGVAVPVRGASTAGITEGDASLSPDQCWMYYARGPSLGTRLYRARRLR